MGWSDDIELSIKQRSHVEGVFIVNREWVEIWEHLRQRYSRTMYTRNNFQA